MTALLRSLRKFLDGYKKWTGYKPRPCPFHTGLRIRSTYPQATPPSFPKEQQNDSNQ